MNDTSALADELEEGMSNGVLTDLILSRSERELIVAALRATSQPTDAVWLQAIEECAVTLAEWYPDNASTNAFCAAIRSLAALGPTVEMGGDARAALPVVKAAGDETDECWNTEAGRLSAGLFELHKAVDADANALRSVAYDIALNCMDAETAAFQIDRRTTLASPPSADARAAVIDGAPIACPPANGLPTLEEYRNNLVEECAQICRRISINAERRAADHTNLEAKQAALDKCQVAQECEQAIRVLAQASATKSAPPGDPA